MIEFSSRMKPFPKRNRFFSDKKSYVYPGEISSIVTNNFCNRKY